MGVRFAVFDFGEINAVTFGRNDVDFVEMSFVVASDDGVTMLF